MDPRCYIEHDGRVLVVQREQGIDLPTEDEVAVPYQQTARREVAGTEVRFGQAKLDEHPWEWPSKDDLATDPDATLLVRGAINASLFRPVVGVIVRSQGEVLLVQPDRGVAKGHWTLPGGFLNAFEQPVEGARREVREEAGIEVEGLELAGTITYAHPGAPYPILGLAFTATAASRELSPHPEEIRQARWFEVADAKDRSSGFAARVLDRLAEQGWL